jgi:hypothetical protein
MQQPDEIWIVKLVDQITNHRQGIGALTKLQAIGKREEGF